MQSLPLLRLPGRPHPTSRLTTLRGRTDWWAARQPSTRADSLSALALSVPTDVGTVGRCRPTALPSRVWSPPCRWRVEGPPVQVPTSSAWRGGVAPSSPVPGPYRAGVRPPSVRYRLLWCRRALGTLASVLTRTRPALHPKVGVCAVFRSVHPSAAHSPCHGVSPPSLVPVPSSPVGLWSGGGPRPSLGVVGPVRGAGRGTVWEGLDGRRGGAAWGW